jgi:DNA-directed RNA polymerase specialized sigma24 family protein
MQPHTDRPPARTFVSQRGDEANLYERHHQALLIAVSHAINGSGALIEDACQTAWTILLRRQPDRASVFAWLYVVAIHEAYRLSAIERRELHLEDLAIEGDWETILAGRVTVEDQLEALEALRALAGLPGRQRQDLSLRVAGFTYREIAAMTGGRTFTNVNKHLVKARTAIRRANQSDQGAKDARPSSS